jgi:hypothetical protein
MVEIETEIAPIDFERLWTLRRETLQKTRLLLGRRPLPLGRRLLQDRRRPDLFRAGEVEMPESETVPPPPPAVLAPHVLLLAPRNDPRFTSKRLADRATPSACWPMSAPRARRHEDRRVETISVKIPLHLRRRANRLRRAQLDHQQHPAGEVQTDTG